MSENEQITEKDVTTSKSDAESKNGATTLDVVYGFALDSFRTATDKGAIEDLLDRLRTQLPEHRQELGVDEEGVEVAISKLEQAARQQQLLIDLLGDVTPLTEANAESVFGGLTAQARADFIEAIDRFDEADGTAAIGVISDLRDQLSLDESYSKPVSSADKERLIKSVVGYARLAVASAPEAATHSYITKEFIDEVNRNRVAARHYLEFCSGLKDRFEWVNVAILNFSSKRRPQWLEELSDWFEVRKRIDARLDTESAKYRWHFEYRDKEGLGEYSTEIMIGAQVHAHLEHHLRYLTMQEANGGISEEEQQKEEKVSMTVLLDEKWRGDFNFDLSEIRKITDEKERRGALYIATMRELGVLKNYSRMDLTDKQRALLHEQGYSNNREGKAISEFYKNNPKYIINFHSDPEASPNSIFDPTSLGFTANADWCLTYDQTQGDLQFKVNHRWNGVPVAPWLVDVADESRQLLDYYNNNVLRMLDTQMLPKLRKFNIKRITERRDSRTFPIQEAVVEQTAKLDLPYATFDVDGESYKFSESFMISQAIAVMNDTLDFHLLADAKDAPWTQADIRHDNLQAILIMAMPFLIKADQAYVQEYVKETLAELKRAKRGQATSALYTAPLGEAWEPSIAPWARNFQRAINLLAASHGQISITPSFLLPDRTQDQLTRIAIKGFDTARPMNQTHAEFDIGRGIDSVGVIGITDDPVTHETKLSVRLEPIDVPLLWRSFVRHTYGGKDNSEASVNAYYAALNPLIKEWGLYCRGESDLKKYDIARNEAYDRLVSLGMKNTFQMFGQEWKISSPADFTSVLNGLLTEKAKQIISEETVKAGLDKVSQKIIDYGGQVATKSERTVPTVAQAA